MELLLASAVYGYMNGAIFKVFGVAILIFELLLVLMFVFTIPRVSMSGENVFKGQILFLAFLLLSTVIAVGLIHLHRWAVVTASALGLIWSLALAASLGHRGQYFWLDLMFGGPVVFGMLLPLYATIRNWSSLRSTDTLSLKSFFRDLRSLDRLHLE